MAARALVLHTPEATGSLSDRIGRTEADLRPLPERSREVFGALLASARESAGLSARALALDLDVSEMTVRRWESGERPWPAALLDRLPVTVADKLTSLIASRVRAHVAPLSAQEIERSLDRSIGRLMAARGEGRIDAAALLDLEAAARRAAGRASGGER